MRRPTIGIMGMLLSVVCARCGTDKQPPVAMTPAPRERPSEAVLPPFATRDTATLFAAYKLSDSSFIAALSEDADGHTPATSFDSLLLQLVQSWPAIDTSRRVDRGASLDLYESGSLTHAVRRKLPQALFVYGTKGAARCRPGRVAYTVSECGSSVLALLIDGYDTAACGAPLFASFRPVDFRYGGVEAERKIRAFDRRERRDYEYLDSLQTTVAARSGNLYFTYTDDFTWNRAPVQRCYFPGRAIYRVKGAAVEVVWARGLDLFGIPCD